MTDVRSVGDAALSYHQQTECPGSLLTDFELSVLKTRFDWVRDAVTGADVLELGCGAGFGAEHFGPVVSSLVCADFSAENVRLVSRRVDVTVPVVRLDAQQLPFRAGSFDVVVALAMIYYLDFDTFVAEVRRVLRPGGRLLFCTSNKDVSGFVPAPLTKEYHSLPVLHAKLLGAGFASVHLGAFRAGGGVTILARAAGALKNVLKRLILIFPGGAGLWRSIRSTAQGPTKELPARVSQIECTPSRMVPVLPDFPDRVHRVIYTTAERAE